MWKIINEWSDLQQKPRSTSQNVDLKCSKAQPPHEQKRFGIFKNAESAIRAMVSNPEHVDACSRSKRLYFGEVEPKEEIGLLPFESEEFQWDLAKLAVILGREVQLPEMRRAE
eukprot:12248597-Karenia_brevis.AAC.1